ncbi:MAG: NACHT domain-containing protein [Myxococcales bacterium]|nr:NACHT domain-containing protein [Myxococcales bacterium]
MSGEDDPKAPKGRRFDIEGDLVARDKIVHNHGPNADVPERWSPPPLVGRYLDWLAARRVGVDLRGVGGADLRLDLREVYVPLSLTRQRREDGPRAKHWLDPCEGVDFEIAALFAHLDACRHALILGHPGSGKTTALRKLAQLVGDQALRARGDAPPVPTETSGDAALLPESLGDRSLPVFVRLRTFKVADINGSLEDFVARELADVSKDSPRPLDRTLTAALWGHGQLVLLLDGLDEIADTDLRAQLCDWLGSQLKTNRCLAIRAVVTSRFSGHDGRQVRLDDALFARIEVRPLSPEQARVLITRWFDEASRELGNAFPRREALARAAHLATSLEDTRFADRRRAMYATPLILTLLCVVVQRGHSMPENRAKFYQACLEVLLETWQRAKHDDPSAAPSGAARPLLHAEAAIELLHPIAAFVHESEVREQVERDELIDRIGDRLDELGHTKLDAEEVLEWLRKQVGIFDELAPGEYGFFHLGLQEYLTALDIATVGAPAIDRLAQRFADSWWREVTLLAVSFPGRGVFARLMDQVLDVLRRRDGGGCGPSLLLRHSLRLQALSGQRPARGLLQSCPGAGDPAG